MSPIRTPDSSIAPARVDPVLRSTALLDEVADRYPRAVSLAAGRPVDPARTQPADGHQEALAHALRALRRSDRDVVLAVAPTYIGLTRAARLAELPVVPVADGPRGVDLDDLAAQVHGARAAGLRPRALYLVPDFATPAGIGLDLPARHELLDLVADLDLPILEDDPYGPAPVPATADPHHRPPSLHALDTRRRVIHVDTFTRSGHIPPVTTGTRDRTTWAARVYLHNPRHLLEGLAGRFGHGPLAGRVHWHSPACGPFTVLTVPFVVDDALLEVSAREFGVLWTPMAHFYDPGIGPAHRLRLSGGDLDPARIDAGLDRLAALVGDRTGHRSRRPRRRVSTHPAP
ncbi:hypothetical protein B4N89_33710 [Embleya scabrispora]|uniref:Aminotransferase class I/classII large domain-containing protein n=1 Tax=Embleya scabrispora TaxID=159449 RepID=A0A1T3NQK1_9ACTN|nr:aminotransferase class I/II-fold pyridoxal phosphate-dependent enzyme [Embleya scabrispora]OPC79058.1 hypothetical protein B4N89_33710 [Embleya scabrispora]